jgi:hypothetical protein
MSRPVSCKINYIYCLRLFNMSINVTLTQRLKTDVPRVCQNCKPHQRSHDEVIHQHKHNHTGEVLPCTVTQCIIIRFPLFIQTSNYPKSIVSSKILTSLTTKWRILKFLYLVLIKICFITVHLLPLFRRLTNSVAQEPVGSSPHSPQPATGPCPEPVESNPHPPSQSP